MAAGPGMLLFHQHVVIDVADGQRAIAPDQPHHLAQIRRVDRCKPFVAVTAMTPHRRKKDAQIPHRHIGQRVGPIFEHRLVDALRLMEMFAPVAGNARKENVVVAARDHVDGVDLHIAEMLDRGGRPLRPLAERRGGVEPLRAQPDASGLCLGQGIGLTDTGHSAAM